MEMEPEKYGTEKEKQIVKGERIWKVGKGKEKAQHVRNSLGWIPLRYGNISRLESQDPKINSFYNFVSTAFWHFLWISYDRLFKLMDFLKEHKVF